MKLDSASVGAVGLVGIAAGAIELRDEGSRTSWRVDVPAYRIGTRAVTPELYCAVTGEPEPADPRLPVTDVSWLDAIRFCNLLSAAQGLRPAYSSGADRDGLDVVWDRAANGYRLPSEAEWEYACRAGSSGVRYGELDKIGWYRENSGTHLHKVGGKLPNAWGLYDTIGNVWEWCWDRYDPVVYGPYRVFRGGGAFDHSRSCRASCRRKSHPTFRIDDLGFRIARNP
ncbi:sulfatase-modifying factor enzyme 1 [Kribbella voronezhensis]|uniref:Sulfatase-modifying factor enzyme 1 n=1 Tax=Kribbella voronezhensis TaxID=2512212 RepID=A0A4R7T8P9_9ACTN|nr:SUMF1/EgtB/PvdO family nonheme iron enzyme [Kribbella voronezhensis]TDU87537.1 sulfatase-modifying factor enzyme 1 [Kribbella voronezhensis]